MPYDASRHDAMWLALWLSITFDLGTDSVDMRTDVSSWFGWLITAATKRRPDALVQPDWAGRATSPLPQIIQKLRCWRDTRDQQVVTRPRACHVQQVPLGGVDLLQVGLVAHALDALLKRQHLVVTGQHGDRTEL